MKKFLVFFVLFVYVLSFASILEKVSFSGLNSLSEDDLKFAFEEYVGKDVNDYAINNIIRNLKSTGYFSSVEWTKIEKDDSFELLINVVENRKIEKVELVIDGAELIDKETLQSSITLVENKPFSFSKFRESIQNITELYENSGYLVSNVFSKKNEQAFIYVTGNVSATTVTFKVTEYALYDVEFLGETKGIEEVINKINEDLKIKRYKDYLSKNWLLRLFDSEKEYYPKSSDIQAIFQELGKYVYFSPYSNIQVLEVDTEKPSKKFQIYIVQNRIVKEPVYLEKIDIVGNTLNDFNDIETLSGTFTNIELLNLIQKVKSWYDENEYFVNVQPKLKNNIFEIKVVEYKVGDVNIEGLTRTKEYTFNDLIKVDPGDYASRKDLRDTYIEIYKTQFFESIDFDITPSSTDLLNVNLLLKEKEKRFNFIGGGAWGPPSDDRPWYEGFAAQVQLKTVNPFGLGQTIGLNLSLGINDKSIGANYSIRKPFGTPLIFGSNLKYSYKTYETDESSNNFDFELYISSLKINNNSFSAGLGINYEESTSTKYLGGYGTLGYTYETLDDLIIPTKGIFLSLNGKRYFKLDGNAPVASQFKEEFSLHIPFTENVIFASRVFASQLFQEEGDSIINYLSGLEGLRGTTLSGNRTLLLNNDFRYVQKKNTNMPFYIALFGDVAFVGENYDFDQWNYSFGAELGINVPMFGLIRIGEAYYNNDFNFFFLMGKTF